MKIAKRLPIIAGLALLGLTGCIVAPGHDRDHGDRYYDGYRYEHGDRVDRNGHRDEHWCDDHRDFEHCH